MVFEVPYYTQESTTTGNEKCKYISNVYRKSDNTYSESAIITADGYKVRYSAIEGNYYNRQNTTYNAWKGSNTGKSRIKIEFTISKSNNNYYLTPKIKVVWVEFKNGYGVHTHHFWSGGYLKIGSQDANSQSPDQSLARIFRINVNNTNYYINCSGTPYYWEHGYYCNIGISNIEDSPQLWQALSTKIEGRDDNQIPLTFNNDNQIVIKIFKTDNPFYLQVTQGTNETPATYDGCFTSSYEDGEIFPIQVILYAINIPLPTGSESTDELNANDIIKKNKVQDLITRAKKVLALNAISTSSYNDLPTDNNTIIDNEEFSIFTQLHNSFPSTITSSYNSNEYSIINQLNSIQSQLQTLETGMNYSCSGCEVNCSIECKNNCTSCNSWCETLCVNQDYSNS